VTDVRHDGGRAGRGRDAWVEPGQDLDALLARWGSEQDGPFRGGRHAAPEPDPRPIAGPDPAPFAPPSGPAVLPGGGPGAGRAATNGQVRPGAGAHAPVNRAGREGGSGGARRARPDDVPPPAWVARAAAPNGPAPAAPAGAPAGVRHQGLPAGPTPGPPPAAHPGPRPGPTAGSHPGLPAGSRPGLTAGRMAGPGPIKGAGVGGPATPGPPSFDDAGAYVSWLAGAAGGTPATVLEPPAADGHDLLTHGLGREVDRGYQPDPWGADDYPPPPGPSRGRHRHSAGRPRWLRVLGWIGAFVGVLVVAGGGYGLYQYHKLSGNIRRIDALSPHDRSIRDAAKQLDAENYLLIGSDTRAGENGRYEQSAGQVSGERSDTTILAHLSPNREKAILVSFPRDSWVRLPACRKKDGSTVPERDGQFNEAFAAGGPACTVLAVQRLTGIKISHYVQVDFTGFKTMVDAVDGVPICSTTPLRDSESGLRLAAGTSTLRGEQALAYVRARYGIGDGSDLGRIQRQQRFLGAMIRKATSTRLLVNPVALTRFLNAATKSLTLDRATSFGDLKALADQLRDLDPKRVSFLTAPIANPAYNPPGFPAPPPGRGGSKVLLDDVAGRKLWDSIINDRPAPPKGRPKTTGPPKPTVLTVAPEDVTVRVLNGVGLDGLARKVGGELQSAGFQTVEPTNAVRTATTTVRYAPAQAAAARTLAAAVPGAVLQPATDTVTTLDLVVGENYTGVVTVKVGDPATAKTAAPPGKTAAKPTAPAINAADARCS